MRKSRRRRRTPGYALFNNLGEDIKQLPERQNLYIAAIGGALALAVHPADDTFNERLRSHDGAVNAAFAPGKYLGNTPEQVALSVGTYVVGRWRHQPKVAHLGMDLLQAQLLTETMVEPMKLATHRACVRTFTTELSGRTPRRGIPTPGLPL